MRILKIYRKRWRRGGSLEATKMGEGPVSLLNIQGFMCCLGFCSNQIEKIPKNELLGCAYPYEIKGLNNSKAGLISWDSLNEVYMNSEFTQEAAGVNDSISITEKEREEKLTELFKNQDIKVEFIG